MIFFIKIHKIYSFLYLKIKFKVKHHTYFIIICNHKVKYNIDFELFIYFLNSKSDEYVDFFRQKYTVQSH